MNTASVGRTSDSVTLVYLVVYSRLQSHAAPLGTSALPPQVGDPSSGGGGIRTLDTPLRGITP
jgi:hypothetical protein